MSIFGNKKLDIYEEEPVEYKNVQPTIEPIVHKPETPSSASSLKMKMFRPTAHEEVLQIADCLKAGQTVVLNLALMDSETAKRMIDYLAGVLYAINGNIERSDDRSFVLAPSGVSLDSQNSKETDEQ